MRAPGVSAARIPLERSSQGLRSVGRAESVAVGEVDREAGSPAARQRVLVLRSVVDDPVRPHAELEDLVRHAGRSAACTPGRAASARSPPGVRSARGNRPTWGAVRTRFDAGRGRPGRRGRGGSRFLGRAGGDRRPVRSPRCRGASPGSAGRRRARGSAAPRTRPRRGRAARPREPTRRRNAAGARGSRTTDRSRRWCRCGCGARGFPRSGMSHPGLGATGGAVGALSHVDGPRRSSSAHAA